jgi:hypothetical protein
MRHPLHLSYPFRGLAQAEAGSGQNGHFAREISRPSICSEPVGKFIQVEAHGAHNPSESQQQPPEFAMHKMSAVAFPTISERPPQKSKVIATV